MIKIYPKAFFDQVVQAMVPTHDISEAKAIAYLLLENKLQWQKHHILVNDIKDISQDKIDICSEIANKVSSGEPIQYLLENAEFYGLDFYVNQSVLIPRPETEELVDIIIQQYLNDSPKILDIGTGSGCIPIALKKSLPQAVIYALDISEAAIEVAKKNALSNNVNISFEILDILNATLGLSALDCIVSNPPYIGRDEIETMTSNTSYEPEIALFPICNDPLVFYRRIAEIGKKSMKHGGKIYLEINEHYPDETMSIFHEAGYQHSRVLKDLNGKSRILIAENL